MVQMKSIGKTEDEIIKNWESLKPKISIVCMAYNHESYIRDAIEGFLMQETNFGFEIIIHDDASTDNTANIIREYEKFYPKLIKPIYQKVNQHSQQVGIFSTFIEPLILADLIAVCEGDDYWIESTKLQSQYDALQRNPSCAICFHPARMLRGDGTSRMLCRHSDVDTIIPVEDVVVGGGGFMPTASIIYKKEIRKRLDDFREQFGSFRVGDVMLQFLASIPGGALYIPLLGSVYRFQSNESWSSRMATDPIFAEETRRQTIVWNESLNEFSEYQYDSQFKKKIQNILYEYISNPMIEKDEKLFYKVTYPEYFVDYPRVWLFIKSKLRLVKYSLKRRLGSVDARFK